METRGSKQKTHKQRREATRKKKTTKVQMSFRVEAASAKFEQNRT